MDIDPRILVELTKIISEQNKNPVRIEKNLVQQNLANDNLSKSNNSEISKAQQQQIFEQLCHMEQQKKLYNQLVTEEPLGGSKSGISEDRIRAGDLGKSGPEPDALKNARATILFTAE